MRRKAIKLIGLPLVLIFLFTACTPSEVSDNESTIESLEEEIDNLEERNQELEEALLEAETPEETGMEENVEDLDEVFLIMALELVKDIKSKDFDNISDYLGEEGLLFSPYGYIDRENAIILSQEEVENLEDDNEERKWGSYDGSGEPIVLSFDDYYSEFIYDEDFLNPEIIGNNVRIGQGNTLENIHEVFEDAQFVEFHFTGFEEESEGMDWVSLRLVFREDGDSWKLVAIVHDQWTI